MSSPTRAQPLRDDNPRTEVNSSWVVEPPWGFETIFYHHFDRLRELREINVASAGYAVVGVFANRELQTYGWLAPAAGSGQDSWVFGRHQRCDLRLRNDPTVALRHLLVRLTREGGLALDDLASGQGFEVDGLGRCRGATADGLVCVRIGAHVLLFLPVEVSLAGQSPREVWERLLATRRSRASGGRRSAPLLWSDRETRPAAVVDPGAEVVGHVVASRNQIGCVYPVTGPELDQGLIFGRYRRCDVRLAPHESWSAVSRVHALLCRWQGEVWVLDLASTNGLKVEGQRLRRLRLRTSTSIELGDGHRVYWRPAVVDD